jgi:hypothetical protein
MKESVVEINENWYRYQYDPETQKTQYLGPVGDSPTLSEEEFLREMDRRYFEDMKEHLEAKIFTYKGGKATFDGIKESDELGPSWVANLAGDLDPGYPNPIHIERVVINQREKDTIISYRLDHRNMSGRFKVGRLRTDLDADELWRRIHATIERKAKDKLEAAGEEVIF